MAVRILYRALALCALLLAFTPHRSLQQRCTSSNDLGTTACVLLTPYYSEYQWATCLTDDYIMRSSDQQHYCRDSATICWYQCMVELYDAGQGAVNDDCRCSPNEVPMTVAPTDDLPPHCYSPRGDDCSWYRQCLEVRYPCEGTGAGYAIEYAEKFCNLYADNYNDFSAAGRAWIDGVRKCLQVVLVPSLRPFVARTKTCSDIRREAFDSHPNCYINPASAAPGICELPCLDVWKSFWLVSFEGGALTSTPYETGKQMLSVAGACFGMSFFSGCLPAVIQTGLLITVPYRLPIAAAIAAVNTIAETQRWESNGFRWLPFIGDDDEDTDNRRNKRQITETGDTFDITILLVDAKALNITNGTSVTPPGGLNLDQAVGKFASAVKNGEFADISVNVDGTQMKLSVLSAGQCGDVLCNSTNVTELAIAPSPSSAVAIRYALAVQVYFIALLLSLMTILLM